MNPKKLRSISSDKILQVCILVLTGIGIILSLIGCPVNINRVPGDTEKLKDPTTGRYYYLYIPSYHNLEEHWPIIVTCHGSTPFDTAWHQIHEWRGLAEKYGFIVIAPELKGTNSTNISTMLPSYQVKLQREDERAIVNIVRSVVKNFNGDENHIYLTGWSGGGYAVYYTGLKHPEIFRALVSKMGNFDERFLPDVLPYLDPYQPILIMMAGEDFPTLNAQSRAAYNWLKKNGMKRVSLREITGIHYRKPKNTLYTFRYFRKVTEDYTFIRLKAIVGVDGNPLKVQFILCADPKPRKVIWDFGDGQTGEGLTLQHYYKAPGKYVVRVFVLTSRSARTERRITVDLTSK